MKNRINQLFETKTGPVLSVYYTAGYPHLGDTVSIAHALEDAGVDMIEIGIPFSDPVADGPVIQQSNKVALDNGMTVSRLLAQVREIRQAGVKLPVILMGYLNPVLQYGVERFCIEAGQSGVDGLILPDLPLQEYENLYRPVVVSQGLRNVFLISPTTSVSRIQQIDAASASFIYAVSASSTTGAKKEFSPEQVDYFIRLQAMGLKNPLLVGFGISNHATFLQATAHTAGAIVGSAFVQALATMTNLSVDIRNFVVSLRGDAGQ